MKAAWRQLRALGALSLLAGVGGCATYHPIPLQPSAEDVLRQPSPATLESTAASLNHPILKPIDIDFSKPLSPEELAILAVVANPDLKAIRQKAGVADAQVLSAGLLPDPNLVFSFNKRMSGPDPFNAAAGQLIYELTALRDRRATRAAARASREQVRFDIAWQEWQTSEQAKLLAYRIIGLTSAVQIATAILADQQMVLSRVEKAAARGDINLNELETRRLLSGATAERLRQTQRDLTAAKFDLNRLLGWTPVTQFSIVGAANVSIPYDQETLFVQARASRLDLRALEAGYESQEATVRKAILDQFPSLQLTVNRAQDTAKNQTIGSAVNFVLPLWNRNRGGIASAEATRDQLRAEYATRIFTTRADIAALCGGLAIARVQREEIYRQIAPLERLTLASERALSHGDTTILAVSAVRQNLLDRKLAVATLDELIAEQTTALELDTGRPFSPGSTE